MTKRILLVEDEESLHDLLKLNLELDGNKVIGVKDGEQALMRFEGEQFDLIILDVMLPKIDGFSVCESIRLRNKEVPILFLSAKNQAEDRISGLKLGGDDYLSKPFNLEELQLRVGNLLNRNSKKSNSNTASESQANEIYFGPNYVNFDTHEARGVNGNVTLTKKEILLFKLLVEHKNEVVSREKILQTVWGYSVFPSTRTVDNFILSFRKYFELNPKTPKFIKSIRGFGYIFDDHGS